MDATSAISDASVGPEGVLIFRGSTFAIKDFQISLDEQGNLTSSMRPQIAWELWPLWFRVAIDHEFASLSARGEMSTADSESQDGRRAELIEDETRAGLVTISAVAFGLEAMALSAATRAGLPAGIGASASAARRIAEVLKQCFALPPERFMDWRLALIQIFDARNAAVHPDAGLRDPMPHPAVRAAVPRPAHIFRLENARASVVTALSTATLVAGSPRPRLGKQFRDGIGGWVEFADDLCQYRESLAAPEVAGPSAEEVTTGE